MSDLIRVILADDHPALRCGLRILLDRQPDITVIAEADTGTLALRQTLRHCPDVLVLDCQLPELAGTSVAADLANAGWQVSIVALSAYDDDGYLAGMIRAGAKGYVLKNEAPSRIIGAVRKASDGVPFWTPEQKRRAERWEAEIDGVRRSLTRRETEVLVLVAEGLSNKEIAQRLVVTVRTVDFHVSNILRKLGAVSRVEAALWAQAHLGP